MSGSNDTITARQVAAQVRALADAKVAQGAARFFKCGPGQYGADDVFIGLRAAQLHQLAREHQALSPAEAERLLQSEIHEERALALLILVRAFARADKAGRKEIHNLYLANTSRVNNWDLVDCSAPTLVGGYLEERSRKLLDRLARSKSLWERRIAMVATQHFIRQQDFADALRIAEMLLADREDLIHKAAGWMLREISKRDLPTAEAFLDQHCRAMPRTMLRYAIEKLPPEKRQAYLRGNS